MKQSFLELPGSVKVWTEEKNESLEIITPLDLVKLHSK